MDTLELVATKVTERLTGQTILVFDEDLQEWNVVAGFDPGPIIDIISAITDSLLQLIPLLEQCRMAREVVAPITEEDDEEPDETPLTAEDEFVRVSRNPTRTQAALMRREIIRSNKDYGLGHRLRARRTQYELTKLANEDEELARKLYRETTKPDFGSMF